MQHCPNIGIGIGISLRSTSEFSGLLNLYPGAVAAYSLKSLSRGWTSKDVIIARRVNTPAESGFTQAEIENGTLATWSLSGDVFVKTFHDQSGQANDATNVTDAQQRQIVSSGVVVTDGGEPAVSGGLYGYDFTSKLTTLSGAFSILSLMGLGGSDTIVGDKNSDNPRIRTFVESVEMVADGAGEINFLNTDNAPTSHTFNGDKVLVGIYRDVSDSIDITIAGKSVASGPQTLAGNFYVNRMLSRNSNSNPVDGVFQELIIWDRDIR
jgi:hypothetical protein